MPDKPMRSSTEVMAALLALMEKLDMPPTVAELQVELGVGSTATVHRYLAKLAQDGLIRRWRGARGIKLLPPPAAPASPVEPTESASA